MSKFKVCVIFVLLLNVLSIASDVVTTPFNGVTHIHRTLTDPRPLNINILRIDLTNPNIGFIVSPSNGSDPGDADGITCSQFLTNTGAQIAINAGFFNMQTFDVSGLVSSNGDAYSPFYDYATSDGWPSPVVALDLSIDNVPTMVTPGASTPTTITSPYLDPWNTAPGSEWIVVDGVNVTSDWFLNGYLNPKTVAGYTQDRSELILVTIDGRQDGFSEGMTTFETADLLISLGAYQGINFDGGGSTTMAFADPTPHAINSPSDGANNIPYNGYERRVPNHLGVYTNGVPEIEIDMPVALKHISFEDNFGGAVYIDDQGGQVGDIQCVAGGPAGKAGEFNNPRVINTSGYLTGGLGDALSLAYQAHDAGTIAMYLNVDEWESYLTMFDINGGGDSAGNIWKSYLETDGDMLVRISSWNAGFDAKSVVGLNNWFHYAFTWERNGTNVEYRIYLDGDLIYNESQAWVNSGSTLYVGAGHPWNSKYDGLMDEFYVFDEALSTVEILNLIDSVESGNLATDPRPFVGDIIQTTNVNLSWQAPVSVSSPSYNVYLSTTSDFEGVSPISVTTNTNVNVTVDIEQNYYWKVDVVDGSEIHEGIVWSFESPLPQAYALQHVSFEDNFGIAELVDDQNGVVGSIDIISNGVVGKACEFNNTGDPGNYGGDALKFAHTLGESGSIAMYLNVDELFNYQGIWDNSRGSNDWEAWIYGDGRLACRHDAIHLDYDIDATGNVGLNNWFHLVWTWDKNSAGTLDTAQYINGVQVNSNLGEAWLTPGDYIALGCAFGNEKYVGQMDEFYLFSRALIPSEILSLYDDAGYRAFDPRPFVNEDVKITAALDWEAPAGVASPVYNVYMSTDPASVSSNLIASGITESSYDPGYLLNADTTYYWKVDVVDGSNTYEGIIWNFTTYVLDSDFQPDGFVDIDDFAVIAENWGDVSAPCDGDLDGDCDVDLFDLIVFVSDWLE